MTDSDIILINHAYCITIAAQTVAEALGMHAENMQRQHQGHSIAYDEKAFIDLIEKNGCHHNAVVTNMRQRL